MSHLIYPLSMMKIRVAASKHLSDDDAPLCQLDPTYSLASDASCMVLHRYNQGASITSTELSHRMYQAACIASPTRGTSLRRPSEASPAPPRICDRIPNGGRQVGPQSFHSPPRLVVAINLTKGNLQRVCRR